MYIFGEDSLSAETAVACRIKSSGKARKFSYIHTINRLFL